MDSILFKQRFCDLKKAFEHNVNRRNRVFKIFSVTIGSLVLTVSLFLLVITAVAAFNGGADSVVGIIVSLSVVFLIGIILILLGVLLPKIRVNSYLKDLRKKNADKDLDMRIEIQPDGRIRFLPASTEGMTNHKRNQYPYYAYSEHREMNDYIFLAVKVIGAPVKIEPIPVAISKEGTSEKDYHKILERLNGLNIRKK